MMKEVFLLCVAFCVAVTLTAQSSAQNTAAVIDPQPDANGIYELGPGVTPPQIEHSEKTKPPRHATPLQYTNCDVSAVIDQEGKPSQLKVEDDCRLPDEYKASAIQTLQKIKLQPAKIQKQKVPVKVHFRVTYGPKDSEYSPSLYLVYKKHPVHQRADIYQIGGQGTGKVTAPILLSSTDPDFTDEARRDHIQGNVTIELIVNEYGVPEDVMPVLTIGYQLDEKAVQAVRRYRFKPAMRDGLPVAVQLAIVVAFRIY